MANVRNGNSIYVDTAGLVTGSTETNVKLVGIVFTPDAANDTLTLKNKETGGSLKITVKSPTAKQTMQLDFSLTPMQFPGGIYVATCTAGATATLILTSGGAN